MADEGTDLDIVKILFIDSSRDDGLATVPSHLELRMFLVDILGEEVDTLRIVIAPMKAIQVISSPYFSTKASMASAFRGRPMSSQR